MTKTKTIASFLIIVSIAIPVHEAYGVNWITVTQPPMLPFIVELLEKIEDPEPNDFFEHFGLSTAISNDIIVVGKPSWLNNPLSNEIGSAYVYDTSGNLIPGLDNPIGNPSDHFGWDVAVNDDYIVVSSAFATVDDTSYVGRVHVYDANTKELMHTFTTTEPHYGSEGFGMSLAIDGETIVVGAPLTRTGFNGISAGIAYVYDANSGELLRTLVNPNPTQQDYFGEAVAIDGDIIVVGSSGTHYVDLVPAKAFVGVVYLYDLNLSDEPFATLKHPQPNSDDFFGSSVAIDGSAVVVGTPYTNVGTNGCAGTVYVFDISKQKDDDSYENYEIKNPDSSDKCYFGKSVAIDDGMIAISSNPLPTTGLFLAGNVFLFNEAEPDLPYTISNPSQNDLNSFGRHVSLAGNTLVISAETEIVDSKITGAVYVYDAVPQKEFPNYAKNAILYPSEFLFDPSIFELMIKFEQDEKFGTITNERDALRTSVEELDDVLNNLQFQIYILLAVIVGLIVSNFVIYSRSRR